MMKSMFSLGRAVLFFTALLLHLQAGQALAVGTEGDNFVFYSPDSRFRVILQPVAAPQSSSEAVRGGGPGYVILMNREDHVLGKAMVTDLDSVNYSTIEWSDLKVQIKFVVTWQLPPEDTFQARDISH